MSDVRNVFDATPTHMTNHFVQKVETEKQESVTPLSINTFDRIIVELIFHTNFNKAYSIIVVMNNISPPYKKGVRIKFSKYYI